MAPSRMADQVGRVLGGRYRLVAPIGTGASAHVFLADDAALRRRVAVKILHGALADDEAFLRRFRSEAQTAAALRHPHVMAVHDWGEGADGPFLVLEFLPSSLRDLLDLGHLLSPSQAVLVGIQAGEALTYAHRRGLVHRDIKPANLLFDEEGRVRIADFGLARALAEAAWTEPAGAILGTARYASPEQARGLSLDGKADVYSLALVLVEAVTGQVPFAADTTIATLMARIDHPLVAPPELGPLGEAVEAAGQPDPAQRPDSAAFVEALHQAAAKLPRPLPLPLDAPRDQSDPTVVRDPTLFPGGPATAVVEREADAPPPLAPSAAAGRRRRRWPWVAATFLVLLLLGGGAYAAYEASIPEYPVPSALKGMTVEQARAEVGDEEKFKLRVAPGREYDEQLASGLILAARPGFGRQLEEGGTITVILSRGPRPRGVPDLSGMDEAGVRQQLEAKALVAKFERKFHEEVPRDKVVAWAPQGTVARGTEILVTLSDGAPPREIPDLRGKTYDEAAAAITALGLNPVQDEQFDDAVEKGRVISTSPTARAKAAKGSTVIVKVSKGPDLVAIPDVTGLTVGEADARLNAVGLYVIGVDGPPSKRVVGTKPSVGTMVPRKSGVRLVTG